MLRVVLATLALASLGEAFAIVDVIGVTKDVVVGLGKVWKIVENQLDAEMPPPLVDKTERRLFHRLNRIHGKLDRIGDEVESIGTRTIATLLHNVPERMRLELRLNDLYDLLTRVDVVYERMQDYARATHKYERHTLEDFARSIVSHDTGSIVNLVDRIHAIVMPHPDAVVANGVLGMLNNTLQEVNDMICSSAQSPQQVLYSLYNTIAMTELKGYTMVQFSYMLLKLYGRGNFTKEAAVARDRFERRTNEALQVASDAMRGASRAFWRCDPRRHVAGETYEQITELMQGYVINEVDMNSDQTCRENCGEYQYAKNYGCFKNLFCRQQRPCNGKILNCKYVDSDMEICTADPRSGRRYESIEYENGLVYGRRQSCPRGPTKVDSWWRWLFWHCSYCMCLCDEQGPRSDRYFNMRPVMSDIKNNKVITGLRFVKKNRILHLQIQEGTLLPFGNIHPNSTQWVEPEDYRIHDRNVYSGQDYHILTWEKRAIDLDDLEADANHVLTGIRFKELGSHLNFEIYTTPFNFTTGKLIEPTAKSFWKDNPNTDASSRHPRTMVKLYNPDVPTRTPVASVPLSKSDQFVEFTHTDLERDAAQTTVPFIDAQPVATLRPVALRGAGLFLKGRVNYGGFVAPKIIAYDFSEHLKPVFDVKEAEEVEVEVEEVATKEYSAKETEVN